MASLKVSQLISALESLGLIVRPSDLNVVVPPPRNPMRVLTSSGVLGPKTCSISLRISSLNTRCESTRAMPKPERPSTGPCRISLRTVKRIISLSFGTSGAGSSGAGESSVGAASASMASATVSSTASLAFASSASTSGVAPLLIASSIALGLSAFIQVLNTSNVTTCSDLNQPCVYLRSTTVRYGATSTSFSSPRSSRFSASLPTPHGATTSNAARTTTPMTNFFILPPRETLSRQLRVERREPLRGADVVPPAPMQFAAECALGNRLAQQRQQRKLSGLAAGKQLRTIDAYARISLSRPLAL